MIKPMLAVAALWSFVLGTIFYVTRLCGFVDEGNTVSVLLIGLFFGVLFTAIVFLSLVEMYSKHKRGRL